MCCVLFFSRVHIECHIEISNGAGIHPKNAIKKSKPLPCGITCSKEGLSLLKKATPTANTLLIANEIIITLINLSSHWYLPRIKIKLQKRVIIILQVTISFVIPNSFEAKPAVTTVTALWMVNIVPRLTKKYAKR